MIIATAGLSVAQFGASSYINGRLETARRVPIDHVYEATLAALVPLGLEAETVREPNEDDAYLLTRTLDGTPITVQMKRISPKVSQIQIRVGIFGNQSLSRLVQANIDEQLRQRGYETPKVDDAGDEINGEA